jgi:hypothetical protein
MFLREGRLRAALPWSLGGVFLGWAGRRGTAISGGTDGLAEESWHLGLGGQVWLLAGGEK